MNKNEAIAIVAVLVIAGVAIHVYQAQQKKMLEQEAAAATADRQNSGARNPGSSANGGGVGSDVLAYVETGANILDKLGDVFGGH